MVAVVATRELQPGDMLMRYMAQDAQDDPRHGNDDHRLVEIGTWMLLLCVALFSPARWVLGTRLCVYICVCVGITGECGRGQWGQKYVYIGTAGVCTWVLRVRVDTWVLHVCVRAI